jgi:hypothetical protein
MAGSYWSSQHCKAVVEVNAALRARERGACDTATVISRINSSSWYVINSLDCTFVFCVSSHAYSFSISADERGQVLKFMSDVAHSLQLSKSEAFHTFCFDRVIGTACVYVNRFCCATKKLRSTLALLSLSCFCLAVKVDEVPHLSNSMIVAVAQPSIQKCFPNVAVAQPSIQKCFPNAESFSEIATGDVEKMEAELMQQLDFELIVHHPFRIMSDLASATGSSHMLNNANAILRDS